MADSFNCPTSATANPIGLGLTMDSVVNDLVVVSDSSPYYNFDAVAKSYPFPMNQFPYLEVSFREHDYLLDDIHGFQIQLYQELRHQVAREDLQNDILVGSANYDLDSISGSSTIGTPCLNTSLLCILNSVASSNYHLPEMPEMPDMPAMPEMPNMRDLSFMPDMSVTAVGPNSDFAMLHTIDPVTPKIWTVESPLQPIPVVARQPLPKKCTRKHSLARSRSGCWICRIKHLKCDEQKPACKNCSRAGIECDYSPLRPDYVSNMELRRRKLVTVTSKKRRNPRT